MAREAFGDPLDNGPEYISGALSWAEQSGIDFIPARKPQQNAYVERYNRTVRTNGWRNMFETVRRAGLRHDWMWTYNHERPNMGLGGITPAQKLKRAA